MKPQRGKTPKKPTLPKKPAKLTDPVEVYCRVRPLSDDTVPSCVTILSTNKVQLSSLESVSANRNGGPIKETENVFQYVFDECTSQKSLYDHAALPLVEDLLNGKNSLLFTYGVTSSGKTHTMMGSPHDQGVLPRCFDVVFNSISEQQARKYVFKPDKMNGFDPQTEAGAMMERQRVDILPKLNDKNTEEDKSPMTYKSSSRLRDPSKVLPQQEDNNFTVFVSYIEIYNNFVYDLLEEPMYDTITGYRAPTSKILREDANHNMYVSNAMEVEVKTTEEAYEVLWTGQKRRKVAHTALNTESSRSHSVFNIRLVQAPLDPLGEEIVQDKDKIVISQLSLVDLAGSERTKRTGNYGDRLREAGNINQSLMVLRTCIEVLRDNQKNAANRIVPYRDSRLTHLFKNFFDGEGKVRMIVCINPRADEYEETLQVMRFSELTQEVQVARPQQICFDKGLAPGRRRLNQQYKQAVSKAVADGVDPALIPQMIAYSWPMIPLINKECENYDSNSLQRLADYLRERQLRRSTLLQDFSKREERFRERLLEVDRDSIWQRERIAELESQLRVSESENMKLQRRLRSVERAYDVLQRTASVYETERRDLEKGLSDRDHKIQMARCQKDQLQQDYHAKLVLSEQNFNRQIHNTRKKTADELRSKQQKLDLVKNILNSNAASSDSSSTPISTPHVTPRDTPRETPRTRLRPALPAAARIQPARSEPNLAQDGTSGTPSCMPRALPRYRAVTSAYAQKMTPRMTTRARSPPPVKPKPMTNPKYNHRRSKSADTWLEHVPVGTVPTGTLLQPKMRKKKSVTKLTEKDTQKASNYVLTHQDVEPGGELSTKLVKGQMVPTGAGGTSVVFTDVEQLQQISPGSRKRRSPSARPEDFEGEWTDTETRCKIAIEGHGVTKRPKTSVV